MSTPGIQLSAFVGDILILLEDPSATLIELFEPSRRIRLIT